MIASAAIRENRNAISENKAAVSMAANSIDVQETDPVTIGLSFKPDGAAQFTTYNVNATLFINSDDGEITLVIPGRLPPQITAGKSYYFETPDEFMPQVQADGTLEGHSASRYDASFQPSASADIVVVSSTTKSGCYLYKTKKTLPQDAQVNRVAGIPDWDQADLYDDVMLHIPAGADRIGALVLKGIKDNLTFTATEAGGLSA